MGERMRLRRRWDDAGDGDDRVNGPAGDKRTTGVEVSAKRRSRTPRDKQKVVVVPGDGRERIVYATPVGSPELRRNCAHHHGHPPKGKLREVKGAYPPWQGQKTRALGNGISRRQGGDPRTGQRETAGDTSPLEVVGRLPRHFSGHLRRSARVKITWPERRRLTASHRGPWRMVG